MSKLIKKIALAITVTLLMVFTTSVVFAEDTTEIRTEPESEVTTEPVTEPSTEPETEPSTDEPETEEPEKELVLYNRNGDIDGDGEEDLWVGLKFEDEYGDTMLDVSYNGKSVNELIEEGYTIECRKVNKYDYYSDWNTIIDSIFDNMIYFPSSEIFQLRILDSNKKVLSMSDRFLINENPEYPIKLSSNLSVDTSYNFDSKSIKITLKYNDNLVLKNINENAYVDIYPSNPFDRNNLSLPYFCTNLKYENHSETISIKNKNYTINYCYVTFYCNFSHYELIDPNSNFYSVGYAFTIHNLIGTKYTSEPYYFFYDINTYKDTSLNPQKKLSIQEHENRMDINKDEALKLHVDIFSEDICYDNLVWVSSDESIATVDQDGNVTAYIYATEDTTDELYDYCIVNVVDDVPVSNLSLDYTTLDLRPGESHQLIATVEPENALDKTLTWSSSDESIATVDKNGLITAKKAGTVSITATSNYDPSITATCYLTVTDPKVESIKISGLPNKIAVGNSFKLKAIISPTNATNKEVTWKSSNTNYATVTSNGVVKIKSAGAGKTVKITVTAKDGSNIKKTITIKIPKVRVTKIKVKATKTTVVAGKSTRVKAYFTPTNATNKNVTWKSSNKKYATVSSTGLVKTKKAGKGKVVTITAISKDNSNVKNSITIKIK